MKNDIETTTIRARGKLLLTGEYAVLDGALALAVPVRFGQMLEVVVSADTEKLHWESIDEQGATWFKATFSLPALELLETTSSFTAERLQGILAACRKQNPEFLTHVGWKVRTRTDFPRRWGLGTSSTLIAALARWAGALIRMRCCLTPLWLGLRYCLRFRRRAVGVPVSRSPAPRAVRSFYLRLPLFAVFLFF
ncbi:MAG: hypothetical protein R3D58_11485 [Saprospiraceae bacterium]